MFNDKVFADFTEKAAAADRQVFVEHGKPMVFGKDGQYGVRRKPHDLHLEVVTIGEDGVTEDDLLVHDETDHLLATMLLDVSGKDGFPIVLGVVFCNPMPSYEGEVSRQVSEEQTKSPNADMKELLFAGNTWTVT